MNIKSFAAATLLAATMTAGAASATTVYFSDNFENPVNTQNWQVYQNFANWSTTEGTGIEVQTSGTVVNARSGNQYVELDSDTERGGGAGPITNSAMTTRLNLIAGTYLVEWYYQPRTNRVGDNTISVYIAGASDGLFDDPAIGSISTVRNAMTDWVKVIYEFTVSGTDNMYALTFRAEGTSNELGGFIEDVSVSRVPVPAGGLLLMTGLGAIAVAARRRRAAA
jgi:hypothetical protein